MRRISGIAAAFLILLTGTGFGAKVRNITLSFIDGATVARIGIDGVVRFTHQTEIPKNGRPDRVILDILSATHELGAKNFMNLPDCPVSGIRTSQFSVKPEKIVRVVFDLKSTPMYRVESDSKSISVILSGKNQHPFAMWSSSPVKGGMSGPQAGPVIVNKPKASGTAGGGSTLTVAQKNKQINDDRLSSLGSSKRKDAKNGAKSSTRSGKDVAVVPKPPEKSNTTAVSKSEAASKRDKKAERNAAARSWLAEQPNAKGAGDKAGESHSGSGPASSKTVTKTPSAPSNTKSVTKKLVQASKDESVAKSPGKSKQSATSNVKSQSSKSAPASLGKTSPIVKPEKKASRTVSSQSVAGVGTKKTSRPKSDKPVVANVKVPSKPKSVAKAKPSTKSSGESKVASLSKKPTQKKVSVATKKPKKKVASKPSVARKPKAKSSKKKELASTTSKKRGSSSGRKSKTSRFRRNVGSAKMKQTMVAEFPKRLVIKYRSRGRRDPFASLLDETRTYDNPIERRIPNVEGTKLVGIIEAENGSNRALLEDTEGYGYILKSGDKVRNGYVLRVENDKVYFQIFEYGWSRTLALSINE